MIINNDGLFRAFCTDYDWLIMSSLPTGMNNVMINSYSSLFKL